jgi:hypothetical protein
MARRALRRDAFVSTQQRTGRRLCRKGECEVLGARAATIEIAFFEHESPTIELQIGGLYREGDPRRTNTGYPIFVEKPPLLRKGKRRVGK